MLDCFGALKMNEFITNFKLQTIPSNILMTLRLCLLEHIKPGLFARVRVELLLKDLKILLDPCKRNLRIVSLKYMNEKKNYQSQEELPKMKKRSRPWQLIFVYFLVRGVEYYYYCRMQHDVNKRNFCLDI